MKNKNLILFIIIGFIVTTALWGFVGGCGTSNISLKKEPKDISEESQSAEGFIPVGSSAAEGRGSYVVEPGDTLWNISKKFNVPISSIKSANNLEKDTISAGQRLVIPGVEIPSEVKTEAVETKPVSSSAIPASIGSVSLKKEVHKTQITPKPGTTIYEVRKDDSLWRIAQTCGTTIERITELNGLSKNAKLTPGQKILVPSNE